MFLGHLGCPPANTDGVCKNEPEGCGACARPFGSKVDELLSPAAERQNQWVTERIASAQAMARRTVSVILARTT